MDPLSWRAPHIKNQFVHTKHQALRKCCGCIHLRVGATLSCLVWIGLSLYFSILSFQENSPFFSYMDPGPLYVFAVASLVLVIVGFVGLFVLFRNRWEYIRLFSRLVWTALLFFLIDGLANACYFITQRESFMTWCIKMTGENLAGQVAQKNRTLVQEFDYVGYDYYNCQRLYEDESKFGLISIFLMIVLYIYWGLCIYSFSHKQGVSNMELASRLEFGMNARTLMGAGPGMAAPPPPPPVGRAGPGRSNVIVLNNERPSSSVNNKEKSKSNNIDKNKNNSSNMKKSKYFASLRSLRYKSYRKNSVRHYHQEQKMKRKSVPDNLLYKNRQNRMMDSQDIIIHHKKNESQRSSSENYY